MAIASADTVSVFAQAAGLAGLAVFLFVYLFREVIRKAIFPRLSQRQAYQIIRMILTLVFLFALSALGVYAYLQVPVSNGEHHPGGTDESSQKSEKDYPNPKADPQFVIEKWMALLDKGSYKEAWDMSDEDMVKSRFTPELFTTLADNNRKPAGKFVRRKMVSAGRAFSPPQHPAGNYAWALYESEFSNGKLYMENVGVRGTVEGWMPADYVIGPKFDAPQANAASVGFPNSPISP